jgi:hydrogenase maturation protein HypF
MQDPERAEAIRIDGIVQGVGFRPTVHRLAVALGLRGNVRNAGAGVEIVVAGPAGRIDALVRALRSDAPPLARIDTIERRPCAAPAGPGFCIGASTAGPPRLALAPDTAVCADCLAETRDPANRRWRHPFANCTACGPRLSIVRGLPYDRPQTSMAGFPLCPACRREYEDPADRRFHAQPIACPDCGPQLRCHPDTGLDPLQAAIGALRAGRIVAVKGIGGYQLACDAGDEAAVARLRERKRRPAKPLALLARDAAMVEQHARVAPAERALLESRAAPIVLLRAAAPSARSLAPSIAPGLATLGFMLPATVLHHRLVESLERPIVLTSGNRADEPQCTGDEEAFEQLAGIADLFLWHERGIVNRVDDAVMQVAAGRPRVIRLGRGLAPALQALPPGFERAPALLALGGELKNSICLLRDGQAVLSQHIGDLGQPLADAAFQATLALYGALFEHWPRVIAFDRHPDHRAAQVGRALAAAGDAEAFEVQHHHAHIAACMAEQGVAIDAPPVLGIALDGLGLGEDGAWWGGEFLCADYRRSDRVASFARVAMPGGMQAIREPWRMAWSYLVEAGAFEALRDQHASLPFFRALQARPWRQLDTMRAAGINCPPTSSCGRLFDAVAALLNPDQPARYEGQAAIELEARVDLGALRSGEAYALAVHDKGIDPAPLWPALLADLARGMPAGTIAARFHLGLADAIALLAVRLTVRHGDPWQHRIALGGGVFQNAVLLQALTRRLEAAGFMVWSPARVPAGDGGLAFGQALVAAARALATA